MVFEVELDAARINFKDGVVVLADPFMCAERVAVGSSKGGALEDGAPVFSHGVGDGDIDRVDGVDAPAIRGLPIDAEDGEQVAVFNADVAPPADVQAEPWCVGVSTPHQAAVDARLAVIKGGGIDGGGGFEDPAPIFDRGADPGQRSGGEVVFIFAEAGIGVPIKVHEAVAGLPAERVVLVKEVGVVEKGMGIAVSDMGIAHRVSGELGFTDAPVFPFQMHGVMGVDEAVIGDELKG